MLDRSRYAKHKTQCQRAAGVGEVRQRPEAKQAMDGARMGKIQASGRLDQSKQVSQVRGTHGEYLANMYCCTGRLG